MGAGSGAAGRVLLPIRAESRLKFFTRSAAAARSAGFAGEKNFVFGGGCRDFCGWLRTGESCCHVLARVPVGIVFVSVRAIHVLNVVFYREKTRGVRDRHESPRAAILQSAFS